jgi:regulator of protease activity HflC (stomatin/prohibitin superfamily)
MNRSIKVGLAIMAIAALGACTRVPAGYAGVRFDMYGSDKGVTGEVVGPGKYWLGWNEELYPFPTFTQNAVWTKSATEGSPNDESITFQDKGGAEINADVGISYSIRADKVDVVFQKYRKGVNEITDIYIRNMVRDALNNESAGMDVADIYGTGKEAMMAEVTKTVRGQVSDIGIVVEKIYWIGPMRLPPSITDAINKKMVATQNAQQRENDLQTATAQAHIAREEARGKADATLIAANAEAESNKLVRSSLSPEFVEYSKALRWDGKLPSVTGGSTPMIDLRATAK